MWRSGNISKCNNAEQRIVRASHDRLLFIDAIRGICALQVLFQHVVRAFFPAMAFDIKAHTLGAWIHASPLFILYDGASAVFMFFVVSGVVLTVSFQRHVSHAPALLLGRGVRLLVPAVAACALAYFAHALWGQAHIEAGTLTGSVWLSDQWDMPSGWAF